MKIVVRGANWIGDGVMTVPALRELRRIFPEASITLHTRPWARGVFQDAEFIDDLLTYDADSAGDVFSQSRVLRSGRYDVGILFPNSFASALTMRLAGVGRRFGYATEGRAFLLSNPVPMPEWKKTRHEVFYYLNLVASIERSILGIETLSDREPDGRLNVADGRRSIAKRSLIDAGARPGTPIVAMGVGSTNSRAKRWPAAYFAELNDRLQSERGASTVIVGSPDELDVTKEVVERSKLKPIVLTGKTSLGEATAILSAVDLMISNDMGLAHIAPAVGTQTLVIFGPTDPRTTRPFSENGIVIRKQVECSPCMLRDCPIDHRCMRWVSVDEVFDRAVQLLMSVK